MADSSKIVGYKKIFGFVLPDWVSEKVIKNLVIGLLSIAVMFLLLIFLVWPNQELVSTKEAELVSSKKSLDVLRNSKSGLDKLETDLSAEVQKRVLSAMPTDYSPDIAIYMLRRISADSGVSIVSYSLPAGTLLDSAKEGVVAEEVEMVTFSTFPIQLTVAAPVESILKFVAAIEASLPFGIVSDLNLQEVTKLSRSANDKTVQITLEVKFFESRLSRVNISKLQSFSTEDLVLARSLSAYNLLEIPSGQAQESSLAATGSGNLFGF